MDHVHVIRHNVLVEGLSPRQVAREMRVWRNAVRRHLEVAAPTRVETQLQPGRSGRRFEIGSTICCRSRRDAPGGKQRLTATLRTSRWIPAKSIGARRACICTPGGLKTRASTSASVICSATDQLMPASCARRRQSLTHPFDSPGAALISRCEQCCSCLNRRTSRILRMLCRFDVRSSSATKVRDGGW
jgi:hypothetical protein